LKAAFAPHYYRLADLRDFGRLEGICSGCSAQAFTATGNYLAADPTCSCEPRNKTADK
jgi:hypothetical protein